MPATAQQAAASPATTPSFLDQVEVFGLADTYYSWFSTKPTGDAQLRAFDQRHNTFSVPFVGFGFSKVPTAESRTGFRLDMGFGRGMRSFHSTEPGGSDLIENILEGYVSYLAPVGKGLQVDVGTFVTPAGAEVTKTKDNWNASRAILYLMGPYYHTGLRVSYPVNDKVSLGATLTNGWNNVTENNTGKTVGGTISLKPTSKLTIIENVFFGPEQTDVSDKYRTFSDTVVSYVAHEKVSLMLNYDRGKEDYADSASKAWQGVALYAKLQAAPKLAVTPRFEWFDDKDAWATGTSQTLKEFTLTGDVAVTPALSWKFEYRVDFSDAKYFIKSDGTTTDKQNQVNFALSYSFSSKQ
ncbi:MAG: porin [Acidobacteriota bacterium]